MYVCCSMVSDTAAAAVAVVASSYENLVNESGSFDTSHCKYIGSFAFHMPLYPCWQVRRNIQAVALAPVLRHRSWY